MKKKLCTLVVERKTYLDKTTNQKKEYVALSVVVNGFRIPVKSVYKEDWRAMAALKADIELNGDDYVQD